MELDYYIVHNICVLLLFSYYFIIGILFKFIHFNIT